MNLPIYTYINIQNHISYEKAKIVIFQSKTERIYNSIKINCSIDAFLWTMLPDPRRETTLRYNFTVRSEVKYYQIYYLKFSLLTIIFKYFVSNKCFSFDKTSVCAKTTGSIFLSKPAGNIQYNFRPVCA